LIFILPTSFKKTVYYGDILIKLSGIILGKCMNKAIIIIAGKKKKVNCFHRKEGSVWALYFI